MNQTGAGTGRNEDDRRNEKHRKKQESPTSRNLLPRVALGTRKAVRTTAWDGRDTFTKSSTIHRGKKGPVGIDQNKLSRDREVQQKSRAGSGAIFDA